MGNIFSWMEDDDAYHYEHFQAQANTLLYPPLSGKDGADALREAERIDGYQTAINDSPVNRYARRNGLYKPSLYTVNRVVPAVSKDWPSGQIIWMTTDADGGLPHTRAPQYICISEGHPESSLAKTLLHERIHIHQRKHTQAWINVYKKYWAMDLWYGKLPEEIRSRVRINPDTMYVAPMIWKKTWVPFAVFRDSTPENLSDTKIVWWNDVQKTLYDTAPIDWKEFFGITNQAEHPFEIAAYLLSDDSLKSPAKQALTARRAELDS